MFNLLLEDFINTRRLFDFTKHKSKSPLRQKMEYYVLIYLLLLSWAHDSRLFQQPQPDKLSIKTEREGLPTLQNVWSQKPDKILETTTWQKLQSSFSPTFKLCKQGKTRCCTAGFSASVSLQYFPITRSGLRTVWLISVRADGKSAYVLIIK